MPPESHPYRRSGQWFQPLKEHFMLSVRFSTLTRRSGVAVAAAIAEGL
jgi:hypothetical protein